MSHTFSIDNADTQMCLKHENVLVPVQNHWESEHFFTSLILLYSGGSRNFQREFQVEDIFNYCQGRIQTF